MYTAKDMYQDLKDHQSVVGKVVDTWLKEEVLPSKLLNEGNNSYEMPPEFNNISNKLILKLLEDRGFAVNITPSGFSFNTFIIEINIPPQGE